MKALNSRYADQNLLIWESLKFTGSMQPINPNLEIFTTIFRYMYKNLFLWFSFVTYRMNDLGVMSIALYKYTLYTITIPAYKSESEFDGQGLYNLGTEMRPSECT